VKTLSVLVLDDGSALTLGGLTLTERAVLLADRAGLPVRVCGPGVQPPASAERLRSRGMEAVQRTPGWPPPRAADDEEGVVVVGPDVLFGPELLTNLARRASPDDSGPMAVYEAGIPLVLLAPAGTTAGLRTCTTLDAMVASLATRGGVGEWPLAGAFCRRVNRADLVASAERDYTRHLTGKGESFFTKKIRRFSVPLTSRLVRFGARPAHVTVGGLALAVAAAWFLARGSYAAGLLGAALYYVSMIFDCSDGEVARLTLRDSAFGAWLETLVDYTTYFLVLIALTLGSQSHPAAEAYRLAAAVALGGSVVVAVVAGYLRRRVAAADPGQFDDASAKALASASASRLHRFARWGRQWIKRSSLAHLVVALALVNQLPALLFLWAFGATVASFVILAVEPFVVRRVVVTAPTFRHVDGGGGFRS
jgi:phosphatidylglycerophosphate synthase